MIDGILIGILIWQFVTFLTAAFTKEDEMPILLVGTGIFGIVTKGVSTLVHKIKKYQQFNGTRSLLVNGEGKIVYCSPKDVDKFFEDGCVFVDYDRDLKDKFPRDLWDVKFRNAGEISPNVRYCPKSVWMKFTSAV